MSIAPISSSMSTYQPSAPQAGKGIRQDFQNLAGALKAGDLPGAKDAFSKLQQLLQGFQSGNVNQAQGNGNKSQDKLGADLTAIGKALQSGDLTSAQDSLKKLLEDMQAMRGGYRQQTQAGQGAGGAAPPSTSASAATGGSTSFSINISV